MLHAYAHAALLCRWPVPGMVPLRNRTEALRRYAGVQYEPNELNIRLGDIALMEAGQPLEFDAKAASEYLTATTAVHGTVFITLSVGSGPGQGSAWGCDLSYDYVKINAGALHEHFCVCMQCKAEPSLRFVLLLLQSTPREQAGLGESHARGWAFRAENPFTCARPHFCRPCTELHMLCMGLALCM
jgi:hypothetical protein